MTPQFHNTGDKKDSKSFREKNQFIQGIKDQSGITHLNSTLEARRQRNSGSETGRDNFQTMSPHPDKLPSQRRGRVNTCRHPRLQNSLLLNTSSGNQWRIFPPKLECMPKKNTTGDSWWGIQHQREKESKSAAVQQI